MRELFQVASRNVVEKTTFSTELSQRENSRSFGSASGLSATDGQKPPKPS